MEQIILVVDDDRTNLMFAQKILGAEYKVAAANSGVAAFRYLENHRPDLILLDLNMPEMDGIEAIERLKQTEQYRTIPVIFLTADRSAETETRCFQAGAVDFVGKPFAPEVLLSRVHKTLELEEYRNRLENMVEEQAEIITSRTRQIEEMQEAVIVGMANLIESRDGSTGKHVKNTQTYVHMLAQELKNRGLYADIIDDTFVQMIRKAAPLHDVGKIKVADSILQKPGKLTPDERIEMQKHTIYSREIIRSIIGDVEDPQYVKMIEDIAMYHHEYWNGEGYPTGMQGEEIPIAARIMALADVFDALAEERCYKPAIRPIERVLEIIEEGRGIQFDPVIAEVFLSMGKELEQYLVRRESSGS